MHSSLSPRAQCPACACRRAALPRQGRGGGGAAWCGAQPSDQPLSSLRKQSSGALRLLLHLLPLRGWVDHAAVETRAATYGRGVFARRRLAPGELVGEYPGVVRTAVDCRAKVTDAASKGAAQYVFQLDSGRYMDPTDDAGQVSDDDTVTAWWGMLRTDAHLARINEPRPFSEGGRANVAAIEQNRGGEPLADSLLIGIIAPIQAGEELLLRYGVDYDRSGYARS